MKGTAIAFLMCLIYILGLCLLIEWQSNIQLQKELTTSIRLTKEAQEIAKEAISIAREYQNNDQFPTQKHPNQ